MILIKKKINLSDFVDFSEKGRQILHDQKSFVADARKRVKYENGKPTDETDGAVLTIQVDRGEQYANSRYNLIVDDNDLDVETIVDEDVVVNVDDVKIYAKSNKGSTYATIEVSLHGHVDLVNVKND